MAIRVLVVDDQSMVRAGLRMLLSDQPDIDVVAEAGNGLEAVAQAQRFPPDVVLMDIRMPELDGLEATRAIRSRWPDRGIRIVAMTANAMAEDREACLAAGMDDYVSKPIRVEELVAALQRATPVG